MSNGTDNARSHKNVNKMIQIKIV